MSQHLIGRTSDGSRVYVSIRLYDVTTPDGATLTNHKHLDADTVTRLSITGEVIGYRQRHVSAAGQTIDDLDAVVTPAGRLTMTDVRTLARIWRRWHLNDMHPACIHQGTGTYPCPVTGYRYGSAWLVEVIPAEVLDTLADITSRFEVTARD